MAPTTRRCSARPLTSSSAKTAGISRPWSCATSRLSKPGTLQGSRDRRREHARGHLERLRDRPAASEERDPVHRRRPVAGASGRGAPALQGHRGGQGIRQARNRRHAAHGAGGDGRQRFDHHEFGQFDERLHHRPQVGGERHGRLCRPHRRIRSTIRRWRPSRAWSSACSAWRSASSPTPRSRMPRQPPWSRTRGGAERTTRLSNRFSRRGRRSSWAAARQISCRRARLARAARTASTTWRDSATPATRSPRPRPS